MSWRSPLALLLLALGCRPTEIDPMKEQPKYKPYAENRFFDDHRAMRPLVLGTVPREAELGDAAFETGLAPDGSYVQAIPIAVTRQALEEGRQRFDRTCAVCHGALGDGDSLPARKMSLRPPPSLHLYGDRPAGFLYSAITQGFGMMPSWASLLTTRERWEVVAYVRALQLSQSAHLNQVPPEERKKLLEPRP